jgi:hypothetical protein
MKKLLWGSLFALSAGSVNVAMADGWPISIVGNWNIIGNQHIGTLTIATQATVGNCRRITGTAYPGTAVAHPIEGFYCPFSGRFQFVRKQPASNDTLQVWTGNVSQDGVVDRMGGTFTSVSTALGGGSLGEYNFQGSK